MVVTVVRTGIGTLVNVTNRAALRLAIRPGGGRKLLVTASPRDRLSDSLGPATDLEARGTCVCWQKT